MNNFDFDSSRYDLSFGFEDDGSFDRIVSRYDMEDATTSYKGRLREESIRGIEQCDESLERLRNGTDTMDDHLDEHHNCRNIEDSIEYLENKKAGHEETINKIDSKEKESSGSKNDSEDNL